MNDSTDPTPPFEMTAQYALSGKVAVVTGSGRGIGLHTACGLASGGVAVVLCSRTAKELESAAARIRDRGGRCRVVCGSVGDEDTRRQLVDTAVEAFGRLDILVNNAGGEAYGNLHDSDLSDYSAVHEINVIAVLDLCQRALPIMKEGGYGRIINLSSGASWKARPGIGTYTPTRAAVNMVTKQLAAEVSRGASITVNGLAPGYVITPKFLEQLQFAKQAASGRLQDADLLATLCSKIQSTYLGRPVEMREVVETICFLSSPAASGMTGEILNLGGGWHAR